MSEVLTAAAVLDAISDARAELPTKTWTLELGNADAFGATAWEFVGLCEPTTNACVRIYRQPHELRVEADLAGNTTIGSELTYRATTAQIQELVQRLCNRDFQRGPGVVLVTVGDDQWELDEFEGE